MAALLFILASMAAASLESLTGTWTHGSPERGGGVILVKDGENGVPISDTTIVASLAAGSDHIDHVNTQLPYALVVASLSTLLFVAAAALL